MRDEPNTSEESDGTIAASYRGKRLLDLAVAIPAMVITAPLLLAAALAVRIRLGSPVLYRQTRLGQHGRPFEILKLRTMSNDREPSGQLLPDGQRLGRLGRALRSSSLDELPQLLDVLRGDMSLVGPRPLLVEYRHRYTPKEWHRHDVRPGITGWTAVHGRNTLSWEQKFEYDLYYVQNYSFLLDLKILWMTVGKVFQSCLRTWSFWLIL